MLSQTRGVLGPRAAPAAMSVSLRRFSPASPSRPRRPTRPHRPVLSPSSLVAVASSANVVVVDDGTGALGAVALATPAPPNIRAAVVNVMPTVLRMCLLPRDNGQWRPVKGCADQ